MSSPHGRSLLARRAEKYLYEDSSPSSGPSDDELLRSFSPIPKRSRTLKLHTDTHVKNLNRSREKTPKLNQTVTSYRSPTKGMTSPNGSKLNASRSRSIGKKSNLKTTRIHGHLDKPVSCQQEKYLLRTKIEDLEKTIGQQTKRVNTLYKRVTDKRQEVKNLTDQLLESKKKDLIVLELRETIKALEHNERNLVEEINEQQKVSKEAVVKLHDLQEEWVMETDQTKKHYQDYCNRKLDEQQDQWEARLRKLEDDNWRLTTQIKEMESREEAERSRFIKTTNNEQAALKNTIRDRELENDKLREDLRMLRQAKVDREQAFEYEIRDLKGSLDVLSDQNQRLKTNEEEITIRESHEKSQLKRRIDQLEEELHRREQAEREKDFNYREHLDTITAKVAGLQGELRKMTEYENRIDQLEKAVSLKESELELSEKYYKEKLESRKIAQENQRREWSSIYNELLGEIKNLKVEIDNLGHENKKLISSFRSRDIRDYY